MRRQVEKDFAKMDIQLKPEQLFELIDAKIFAKPGRTIPPDLHEVWKRLEMFDPLQYRQPMKPILPKKHLKRRLIPTRVQESQKTEEPEIRTLEDISGIKKRKIKTFAEITKIRHTASPDRSSEESNAEDDSFIDDASSIFSSVSTVRKETTSKLNKKDPFEDLEEKLIKTAKAVNVAKMYFKQKGLQQISSKLDVVDIKVTLPQNVKIRQKMAMLEILNGFLTQHAASIKYGVAQSRISVLVRLAREAIENEDWSNEVLSWYIK